MVECQIKIFGRWYTWRKYGPKGRRRSTFIGGGVW